MKVYQLTSPPTIDGMKIVDGAERDPGPNEVVVRVKAVSLNYRDFLMVNGLYPLGRDYAGVIPCSDGAGEVVAVGAKVTRVSPGDRVAGMFMQGWQSGSVTPETARTALGGEIDGMLAEQVVLHEDGLVTLPAHLSFEEGACLPCAAVTAWNGLMMAGALKPGDTVLLQGTGGVSVFGLQFAKAAGARVIITSSSDAKLERARALGADATVNYRTNPEWQTEVRDLTGGRGVDQVIEVGGAGTLIRSMQATRMGGHISVIGVLTGMATVDPWQLIGGILFNNLKIIGIFVGSREMFEAMNRAITQHAIHPVIDRTFSFDQAREAIHCLQQAGHFGKIVIKV